MNPSKQVDVSTNIDDTSTCLHGQQGNTNARIFPLTVVKKQPETIGSTHPAKVSLPLQAATTFHSIHLSRLLPKCP
jgi:hypothetical protein